MKQRREGDEWTFEWEEEGVSLRVTEPQETRDRDLKVQVEPFQHINGTPAPIAARTKANISTPRGKTELTNLLKRRLKLSDEDTWDGYVEKAAQVVLASYREGGEFVRLAEVEVQDELPYLLWPYLPLNETTIAFGDSESGKSMFSALVAFAVCEGLTIPTGREPAARGGVLYLDYETHKEGLARRSKRIGLGLGMDIPDCLEYRRCERSLTEEAGMLGAHIARENIKLVVVDSLGYAGGGDPSDTSLAIEVLRRIRNWGITSLVVAHNSKGEMADAGPRTVFGSSFFRFGPRSMWELRGEQFEDELRQAHYHRKTNDDRKQQTPRGMIIKFPKEPGRPIHFEASTIDAGEELAHGTPLPPRILQYLGKHLHTTNSSRDSRGDGHQGSNRED